MLFHPRVLPSSRAPIASPSIGCPHDSESKKKHIVHFVISSLLSAGHGSTGFFSEPRDLARFGSLENAEESEKKAQNGHGQINEQTL